MAKPPLPRLRPGRRFLGRVATPLLCAAALLSTACSEADLPSATPTSGMLPSAPLAVAASAYTPSETVSVGAYHTCALRSDGVVECWGDDRDGQAPTTKSAASGSFTQVSAGNYHTCALRADGVVECWGSNAHGQAPPTKSAAIGSFTQVSAGDYHTCALRADGVVECWGDNELRQAPTTKSAANGGRFTQVSAGHIHTCALRADGVVECWGSNAHGQAPTTKSAANSSFTQVSSNFMHTCALRADGVVECWGKENEYEDYGQAPPTKSAANGGRFTQVSAGDYHTCALRTDGKVECWGFNDFGQAPEVKSAPTGVYGDPPADGTPPTIALTTPANGAVYLLNQVVLAQYACEDEPGGSGLASCMGDVATGTVIATGTVGTKRFTVRATDAAGNETVLAHDYRVSYPFGGFLSPVNGAAMNTVQAGSSVPIKFSLGGDRGLGILAAGSPGSQPVDCTTSAPKGGVEPLTTTGNSGLSYDARTQQYSYTWKTEKGWAGSCRMLVLTLNDGSTYTAKFSFTK